MRRLAPPTSLMKLDAAQKGHEPSDVLTLFQCDDHLIRGRGKEEGGIERHVELMPSRTPRLEAVKMSRAAPGGVM